MVYKINWLAYSICCLSICCANVMQAVNKHDCFVVIELKKSIFTHYNHCGKQTISPLPHKHSAIQPRAPAKAKVCVEIIGSYQRTAVYLDNWLSRRLLVSAASK